MNRVAILAVSVIAALLPAAAPDSRTDIHGPPERSTAAAASGMLTIKQVAVRQGDAVVVQGPCGELGLIDNNRFREQEVLDVLDAFGSRALEWIAVSHYDADHLGGILGVVTAPGASAGQAIDRGGGADEKSTQTYENYFNWATSDATTRVSVDIGDSFALCSGEDAVTFEVVSAGTDGTAAAGVTVSEENDKGLCLKVTYGDFDFATCGDVNGTDEGSRTDVESAVAPAIGEVDFAKINHHGSAFSSNQTYVDTLSPQAAVVSTGANGFGHPDAAVLARWAEQGDVYQTQDTDNAFVDGTVTVTTPGQGYFTLTTSASRITRSYSLDPSLRCAGLESVQGNHIAGSPGPDVLGGTPGRDVMCGLGGRDVLLGTGGNDVLVGGGGMDTLRGKGGADVLRGGGKPDRLFGGRGKDKLFGGAGADLLNGGSGIDRCSGGGGSDTLKRCER